MKTLSSSCGTAFWRRLGWTVRWVSVCLLPPVAAFAQVNSGSDGSDGEFNYTGSGTVTINMADHADGIYQYTSVNIGSFITVRFIANSNNAPVIWLVQSNCVINGTVDVSGYSASEQYGGQGGPGGFRGGNGGAFSGSAGQGPGGGMLGGNGFSASFGSLPLPCGSWTNGFGAVYGNVYSLPLVGGSGGGGMTNRPYGGGGGGGAILIAASQSISLNGTIRAIGGGPKDDGWVSMSAGAGSGGAVRLVSTTLTGSGSVDVRGGHNLNNNCVYGGYGRIRFDVLDPHYIGSTNGVFSQDFQPIIIPPPNQAVSLTIQSVAGAAVPATPIGQLTTPDVIIPGNQQNPIPIVVRCINIPLNTEIIAEIKPANGPAIRAVGLNSAGTQASSTATISVNMPRGGGTIQAKAVSGIAGTLGASLNRSQKYRSFADTGLTAGGERFAKVEITATLGGAQEVAYLTESGKRYPFASP